VKLQELLNPQIQYGALPNCLHVSSEASSRVQVVLRRYNTIDTDISTWIFKYPKNGAQHPHIKNLGIFQILFKKRGWIPFK
jgi:hypothetical protein